MQIASSHRANHNQEFAITTGINIRDTRRISHNLFYRVKYFTDQINKLLLSFACSVPKNISDSETKDTHTARDGRRYDSRKRSFM
ncbi:hypothetical protein J6590_039555 [Homalodisca vitripennis]|nr:hypothetical protein J6590_039555 [Homalodisca vitripennis]